MDVGWMMIMIILALWFDMDLYTFYTVYIKDNTALN